MKVLTIGVWDLFHSGHINLLETCYKLSAGGRVVVAVNTDEFTAKYKTRPIMTLKERMAVIASCRYVDEVIVNKWDNHCYGLFKKIRPDLLVHGDDWVGESYHKQIDVSKEQLNGLGIRMIYCEYTGGVSSTDIRKRLKK